MESYCLKCKKHTKNIDPYLVLVMVNSYYQNVQYLVVKNLNLLVNKKQVDY